MTRDRKREMGRWGQRWRPREGQRHTRRDRVGSASASPHWPHLLPRLLGTCPGATLQTSHQVANGQDYALREQPPGATAHLQQQMVLEDALNGFQQEALQGQRVAELGLALLQPQGCRRGQRQLPEQG